MPAYRLSAELGVIELIHSVKTRDRTAILEGLRYLVKNPNTEGDWQTRDSGGREIEVKIFGHWQITYWLDSPVWELRVVEVRRISLS